MNIPNLQKSLQSNNPEKIAEVMGYKPMKHNPETKLIPLSQGKCAIVDAEDFEWLNGWKWYYGAEGYAWSRSKEDWRKKISMHRLILNPKKGHLSDHINGNRLDNRRCNLRECTSAENCRNRSVTKTHILGIKGVYHHKRQNIFEARIRVNGKPIYLGCFSTKEEASKKYNEAAALYFGNFARA